MKEKYLTKQDLLNELKRRDQESHKLALNWEVSMLQTKINQLEDSLKDNKSYMDFIDSLSLIVEVDGKKVPVNHEAICFYGDNQDLIRARMQMLQRQLKNKQSELDKLQEA